MKKFGRRHRDLVVMFTCFQCMHTPTASTKLVCQASTERFTTSMRRLVCLAPFDVYMTFTEKTTDCEEGYLKAMASVSCESRSRLSRSNSETRSLAYSGGSESETEAEIHSAIRQTADGFATYTEFGTWLLAMGDASRHLVFIAQHTLQQGRLAALTPHRDR